MSHRNIPSFSSRELQKAVTEERTALEGSDEARNRVSNDIKALEAYLQSLGLKVPFRHGLGKAFVDPGGKDGQQLAASLEEYGGSACTIEEEVLAWAPNDRGRFRLLYELVRWEGHIDVDIPGGPLFCDESTVQRDAKPLIETKFEVRNRMYTYLPDFVRALSSHLTVGQPDTLPELVPDDIPF